MDALIVGGGIAGPVVAMTLQRCGVEARVFEARGPADPDQASYFTVTANGLEALREIGAMELALSGGFPTRRNVLWNHAGRRLATLPLDSSLPGSPAALTIKRSRLARVLQDEAQRRGIPFAFGRRLVAADLDATGRAVARFTDGSQEGADVLIGADGIHSVVRHAISPQAPAARYVGLVNFGGVTRGAARDIPTEAWHLIFGRDAFFGYQATPSGDVVWFVNLPRAAVTPDERARTNDAEWKRQLVERFASDEGPAAGLIEAGELELSADNTHDLAHVPIWSRGPLVIMGDAAHAPAPSSGQGASMALEDALALARALREGPAVAEAFARYERARRERVERVVAWGARGSSDKTPGPFGRTVRDLFLPLLFKFVVTERSTRWMYDHREHLAGDERESPGVGSPPAERTT